MAEHTGERVRWTRGVSGLALQPERDPGDRGGATPLRSGSRTWADRTRGVVSPSRCACPTGPESPWSCGPMTRIATGVGWKLSGFGLRAKRIVYASTSSRRRALPPGRISWNSVRVDGDDDRADRFRVALVRRWRDEGDSEARRVAAQTVLMTPFDPSGPRTREAFDEMRAELGRLFLAASIGEGSPRRLAPTTR